MNSFSTRSLSRLIFVVIGLLPLVAWGQGQDVPPPTAPFVAPLPDSAAWKMVFSNPKRPPLPPDPTKQASGEAYVRLVEIVKSGKVRRERTTWSNNTVTEAWTIGNLNVAEGKSNEMLVTTVSASGGPPNTVSRDFPLLEWIGLQNYKDVEEINGKKYYVFKKTVPLSQVSAGYFMQLPGGASEASAFISIETGLPLTVQVNDVTATYTFSQANESNLSLPEKFQQAITRYQNAQKALRHLPSSP